LANNPPSCAFQAQIKKRTSVLSVQPGSAPGIVTCVWAACVPFARLGKSTFGGTIGAWVSALGIILSRSPVALATK